MATDLKQTVNRTSWSASMWQKFLVRRRRNQARLRSQVRFRLSREGVHFLGVLLFIFVGAVIRDINLLILIAGAMIGLLLLQWRFNTRTLLGLTATRKLPGRVSVGQPFECSVSLTNPKTWLGAWLVLVEDSLSRVTPNSQRFGTKGMALVEEIRPSARANVKYQLQFEERGRYRIGPSTISTRFPIGLGRGWRTLDNATEIIVHPRLGELTPKANSLFHAEREGHSKSASHAGIHEAEFYGLRPWATGDSRRWIHWRTTARLGELSVRQFERRQQQQLCVLLDLYIAKGDKSSVAHQNCERAIAFVATLATRSAKQGNCKLNVALAAAKTMFLANVQSPVLVDNLLDCLATLVPSPSPDRGAAIGKMTLPLLAQPHLLVVSTRSEESAALNEQFKASLGPKSSSRLSVTWLNVCQGDLEPYFSWTSNESSESVKH